VQSLQRLIHNSKRSRVPCCSLPRSISYTFSHSNPSHALFDFPSLVFHGWHVIIDWMRPICGKSLFSSYSTKRLRHDPQNVTLNISIVTNYFRFSVSSSTVGFSARNWFNAIMNRASHVKALVEEIVRFYFDSLFRDLSDERLNGLVREIRRLSCLRHHFTIIPLRVRAT
jgi:hypothetical protein